MTRPPGSGPEEREFGPPRLLLRGQEELSAYLLRGCLDRGCYLAFSNELRADHSITCPIFTVRPQNDLPIVPTCTDYEGSTDRHRARTSDPAGQPAAPPRYGG